MVVHFDEHEEDWGIKFELEDDCKHWKVIHVDMNSHAENLGARKGLKIVAVDGIWINDLNWKKCKKLLVSRHLDFLTFKDEKIIVIRVFFIFSFTTAKEHIYILRQHF